MNYRKKYETLLNIKLPKDWHVHHIDYDRKNNEMDNLVALPRKLHMQHHTYKTFFDRAIIDLKTIFGYLGSQREETFKIIDNYMNNKREILRYINEKDSIYYKRNNTK